MLESSTSPSRSAKKKGRLNDAYNKIATKVNMPGGQGHKLYEQWRVLDDASPMRSKIAEQSKVYYQSIRKLAYAG